MRAAVSFLLVALMLSPSLGLSARERAFEDKINRELNGKDPDCGDDTEKLSTTSRTSCGLDICEDRFPDRTIVGAGIMSNSVVLMSYPPVYSCYCCTVPLMGKKEL